MKKTYRNLALSLVALLVAASFTGCSYESSTRVKEAQKTREIQKEIQREVGMPDISNFYEKKMLKDILELRDDSKLVTYAYIQCEYNGKLLYLGQCIGFGIPYSTQYTNPEQKIYQSQGGSISLPQADPNGLYSSGAVNATWLMYINPDTGKREVIYSEPNLIVTQSKLPKRICIKDSLPSNY